MTQGRLSRSCLLRFYKLLAFRISSRYLRSDLFLLAHLPMVRIRGGFRDLAGFLLAENARFMSFLPRCVHQQLRYGIPP